MDKILHGMPQVNCYLDDVTITNKTDSEHLKNLEIVFERLVPKNYNVL